MPKYTLASMRFLRMLTNSVLAGALGAAYLTVLVLQLNPQMPVMSASTWRWFYTLCMFYGVHLAVLFYVVIVVREFFTIGVLSPGWMSVRLLAWMGAAAAAVAAALMWVNLRSFGAALDEVAVRRMTAGTIATTASAVVLLGIAIAHYSFGRRGSRVGAALFVMAAFASLALPLAARGPASLPTATLRAVTSLPAPKPPDQALPRVTLLMLDGASLDYVWPRVAEGRLPNFARMLESGAEMDLATIRPTQPDPVWAAVATGTYPSRNGVRSAAAYYARNDDRALDLLPNRSLSHALVEWGFVRDEPKTSAAWRARPIWNILSQEGITVGIVRWPLTHPAEPVDGFLVSDRLDQLVDSVVEYERAVHPAEVLPALMDAVASAHGQSAGSGSAAPEASALRRDRFYGAAMRELKGRFAPRFTALRYQGIDTVGHYYYRYTHPGGVRTVSEESRRRYVQIVDRYYAFIDEEIRVAMQALAAGDLLVVVSGFGMGPLHPAKQLLGRLLNSPDHSGTHENAPDGFLLAYGTAVQPGRPTRGSIVDVTPTVLYFLGLPIGDDMDGYARTDLFTRAFTAERPVDFIPSYNR
jgi:predicted AlkP superfamily phosphohydrolase/phosphomutase